MLLFLVDFFYFYFFYYRRQFNKYSKLFVGVMILKLGKKNLFELKY